MSVVTVQSDLEDALVIALDGLTDFDVGRVKKRHLRIIGSQDSGWMAGKTAAVVWRGSGVAGQQAITGSPADIGNGATITALIQIAKPNLPSGSSVAAQNAWELAWETLQENVLTAVLTGAWTTNLPLFNISTRWGEEPPTWLIQNPSPSGAEWWLSISGVLL